MARKGDLDDQVWTFGERSYRGLRIFRVPGFSTLSRDQQQFGGNDLAIIELDRPVDDIKPAKLYSGKKEVGKEAWFVGHGVVGDGENGIHEPPAQQRLAGTNVLDSVGSKSDYSMYSDTTLIYDLDGPLDDDPNETGGLVPTDLEYCGTGGDSGGGVFVKKNGELQLAGILFGGVDANGLHKAGKTFRYGEMGAVVRVSSHRDWIESVLSNPESIADDQASTSKLRFEIIDEHRNPVTGFTVHGETVEGDIHRIVTGTNELLIDPIDPTQRRRRTMVIRDAAGTLGKVVRLDKELVRELDGRIQLLPLATIRAQLFDLSGKPVQNYSVSATVIPNEKHLRRLDPVQTDGQGNIEMKVPCWSKYLLWYDGNQTAFTTTTSVFPGKTYDLGKVRLATGKMVPPEEAKRQQQPAK